MSEVDLLPVALVLLPVPLDAHVVDVVDCQVVDAIVGEPTLLQPKEGEVVTGGDE